MLKRGLRRVLVWCSSTQLWLCAFTLQCSGPVAAQEELDGVFESQGQLQGVVGSMEVVGSGWVWLLRAAHGLTAFG